MQGKHPLRRWRHARGLTLVEVAAAIDVTKSSVSAYENGHRHPRPHIMLRICKLTRNQITADSFLPLEPAE